MAEIVPDSIKKLRACLLCSLIKSVDQFRINGCDNCDQVLSLKGDVERIMDCTSPNYEGMISVLNPDRSWVCKWQRIDKFQKGIYAVQVMGNIPMDIQEQLLDKGIKYRPRDGSVKD
jgi:transcription elongation factor SPT4